MQGETCFAIDTLLDTMDQYPELTSAGIRVLTHPHMWLVFFFFKKCLSSTLFGMIIPSDEHISGVETNNQFYVWG